MHETILHSIARVLARIFVTHCPDKPGDEFTFTGMDIGLPPDEYIVIKVYRRRFRDSTKETDPVIEAVTVTPVPAYE